MSDLKLRNPVITMEVACDIVDPHKIQVIHADPLKALLDGPDCPICRIVVCSFILSSVLEEISLLAEGLNVLLNVTEDEPADLATEAIFRTLVPRELLTKPDLRKPSSIERSGIEISCSC